jgi:hypothetical protein
MSSRLGHAHGHRQALLHNASSCSNRLSHRFDVHCFLGGLTHLPLSYAVCSLARWNGRCSAPPESPIHHSSPHNVSLSVRVLPLPLLSRSDARPSVQFSGYKGLCMPSLVPKSSLANFWSRASRLPSKDLTTSPRTPSTSGQHKGRIIVSVSSWFTEGPGDRRISQTCRAEHKRRPRIHQDRGTRFFQPLPTYIRKSETCHRLRVWGDRLRYGEIRRLQ